MLPMTSFPCDMDAKIAVATTGGFEYEKAAWNLYALRSPTVACSTCLLNNFGCLTLISSSHKSVTNPNLQEFANLSDCALNNERNRWKQTMFVLVAFT